MSTFFRSDMYACRVQLFLAQGDGLWRRFNFFLTISLALIAALFVKDFEPQLGTVLSIIGTVVGIVWFIVSAGDHYFYMNYRCRVCDLEELLAGPDQELLKRTLRKHPVQVKNKPWSFRIPHFGVTPFASIVPILSIVFWIVFYFGIDYERL